MSSDSSLLYMWLFIVSRQIFSSTATKSSAEAVYMINTTLFDAIAAAPELKSVENLSVTNTYQTFTPAMLKAASAAGGDALDLHDPNGNGICGAYTLQPRMTVSLSC